MSVMKGVHREVKHGIPERVSRQHSHEVFSQEADDRECSDRSCSSSKADGFMCVYLGFAVAGNIESQQRSNLFTQSSDIRRAVYPAQNHT